VIKLIKKEVLDYINMAKKKGLSKEDIKKNLLSAGHSSESIDEHFKYHNKMQKVKFGGVSSLIFIFVIALVLFLLSPAPNPVNLNNVSSNNSVNASLVVKHSPLMIVRDPAFVCYSSPDKDSCMLEVKFENGFENYRLTKIALGNVYATGNSSFCDGLGNYSKSVCLESAKIYSLTNISECDSLVGDYVQETCRTKFYLIQSKSDPSYCNLIKLPLGVKNSCLEDLK